MSLSRLNKQHKYLTEALLDGRLIFDQSFELKEGATILDSATGTGEARQDCLFIIDLYIL